MKILILFFLLNWYQASAQDHLVFVFLHKKTENPTLSTAEEERLMTAHLANIQRLADEKKLIAAGPFEEGGGILIFGSPSLDSVKAWLNTDPAVQVKRWDIEMLPYTPRIGSVCSVVKPFEMVMYEFIRYVTDLTKFNVQQAPETAAKHDHYLKKIAQTGNVVAEGIFGDDGGILIIKGDLQKGVIEADPALEEGLYQIQFRKLYIARGAFCEK